MKSSLLFIPDISGFTEFVQSTEAEHSQHVISELLEVLIDANNSGLELAEIEGDALFFYKEEDILSADKLNSQIQNMFTAFYSHLSMLKENRICPCNACRTAPDLQLKIIVHCGELQFLTVQDRRKPFGESVIQVHRLLKNSVNSDNYFLISDALLQKYNVATSLFDEEGMISSEDEYDGKPIKYAFANVDTEKLTLFSYPSPKKVEINRKPDVIVEKRFPISRLQLLEYITNYRNRQFWTDGLDRLEFNENEVTRLGSNHVCVIGGKHLSFTTVTKQAQEDEIVYGELSQSLPIEKFYQFYTLKETGQNESILKFESYLEDSSFLKKVLIKMVMKNQVKKNIVNALEILHKHVSEK